MGVPSPTLPTSSWHFYFFVINIMMANDRVSSSTQSGLVASCPPSSCGNLKNISYPFRLSFQPKNCGDALYAYDFECEEGQHPILYDDRAHKLYVKDIFYHNMTILVAYNISLLPNSCSLLPAFVNDIDLTNSDFDGNTWAVFIKCSQKLSNDSNMEVPCLSGQNTSVYAIVDKNIPDYCVEMDTFLYNTHDIPSSGMEVFQHLQQGFLLHYYGSCATSWSCGNLTNITYPFILTNDTVGCFDTNSYEYLLECEGGKHPVLHANGNKLYVQNIDNYINATFQVVYNISALPNSCSLPPVFQNLSFELSYINEPGTKKLNNWASFVNCTQKLESEKYMEVSCFSARNTIVYVIVGKDADSISYLPEHCNPMGSFPYGIDTPRIGMDVLRHFQHGFTMQWGSRGGYPQPEIPKDLKHEVPGCWKTAMKIAKNETDGFTVLHKMLHYPIIFEAEFVGCFYHREDDQIDSHLRFSVILIIFLHIAIILSVCAVTSRIVLAASGACAILVYNYVRNEVPVDKIEKFLRKQQTLSPTRYTYGDITALTRHFKEKLGQGGFGSVFKGELPGGRLVAVKVLQGSNFSGEEFINEVSTIGRIHHVNIVKLLGFCFDGTKRALVYEYMPNGSLDKYIFASDKSKEGSTLSLEQLNSIALGVAKGIDYLHRGCDMQILHFDIKPHNILLDNNFCPKVSDFGLARLYPRDHSIVSISATRGTIGYIAPELVSRNFGFISYKSDIYSFGMLLMEIAGRRRNVNQAVDKSSQIYYPSWIYNKLTLVDQAPNYSDMNINELEKKLCKVGLWCIQINPSNRPSMTKVIEMLEADVDNIPLAPKPFHSSPETNFFASSNIILSSIESSIIEELN